MNMYNEVYNSETIAPMHAKSKELYELMTSVEQEEKTLLQRKRKVYEKMVALRTELSEASESTTFGSDASSSSTKKRRRATPVD